MNNSFSLREFVSAYETNLLDQSLQYHGMNIKESEKQDFYHLSKEILKHFQPDQDSFDWYLDTDLEVLPDFDALYYSGDDLVLNIDLKHEHRSGMEEKIVLKFGRQERVLRLCSNTIVSVVYFADENKIKCFNNGELQSMTFKDLVQLILKCECNKLSNQSVIENRVGNLTPKDYLISPLNQIDDFMNGHYWLNNEQQAISDRLSEDGIVAVEGEAGTGKTLIAYDFVRRFKNRRKILFVFPGNLKIGHFQLSNRLENVHFLSGKDTERADLAPYDVILVDEAQRMQSELRKKIDEWGRTNHASGTLGIFYDLNQKLGKKDTGNLLSSLISGYVKDYDASQYHLSTSVRSNKYITAFVRNVFDLNKHPKKEISMYDMRRKVNVKYFKDANEAIPWIIKLNHAGYQFLVPTDDQYHPASVDQFKRLNGISKNSHQIIGDEADDVVTYLDDAVAYNSQGHIIKRSPEYYYNDHEYYVNMSRAREHLALAVINNTDVYDGIMECVLGLKGKSLKNQH